MALDSITAAAALGVIVMATWGWMKSQWGLILGLSLSVAIWVA